MGQTIKDSVFGVIDAPAGDGEGGLVLRQVGTVVDLGDPGLPPPIPQKDPDNEEETDNQKALKADQPTWWWRRGR